MDSGSSESDDENGEYEYTNDTWSAGSTSPVPGGYPSNYPEDNSHFNDALVPAEYEIDTAWNIYGDLSFH